MSYRDYEIRAYWGSDGLAVETIADNTIDMLDQVKTLDPAFSNWELFDEPTQESVPLTEAEKDIYAFVRRNFEPSEWNETPDGAGYSILAFGGDCLDQEWSPRLVSIGITAGCSWQNSAKFGVGSPNLPPDYSLITYPIFKGALKAIASSWPCPWLLATYYSDDEAPIDTTMEAKRQNRSPFDVGWIAYLSPRLAAGLTPSADLAPERTPGGGLVLSAVQDLIDQRNPEHMRRSRMLEAILEDRVGREGRRPALLPARIGPY